MNNQNSSKVASLKAKYAHIGARPIAPSSFDSGKVTAKNYNGFSKSFSAVVTSDVAAVESFIAGYIASVTSVKSAEWTDARILTHCYRQTAILLNARGEVPRSSEWCARRLSDMNHTQPKGTLLPAHWETRDLYHVLNGGASLPTV